MDITPTTHTQRRRLKNPNLILAANNHHRILCYGLMVLLAFCVPLRSANLDFPSVFGSRVVWAF